MLTGIGLRNFKAFGDEMQEAPLSKITLIYGPNSGGKSSIIQALLLLKQSLLSYGRYAYDKDRELIPTWDFVDLGSYQALIHKHEATRELGISVKYRNMDLGNDSAENGVRLKFNFRADNSPVLSTVGYRISSPPNDTFLLDGEMGGNKPGLLHLNILGTSFDKYIGEYGPISSVRPFLPMLRLPELAQRRMKLLEQVANGNQAQRDALKRAIAEAEFFEQQIGSTPETEAQQESMRAILESLNLSADQVFALTPENITEDWERHLHSINYSGPMRSEPQRVYQLPSRTDSLTGVTGIQGEFTASVLHNNPSIVKQVNKLFEQFEIPYTLRIDLLSGATLAAEYVAIALKDKRTKTQVTLADVGYGISCILPVIVEGLASREGSIIWGEQPETHIHPRLQAHVADLMIDTIADEPGKRKQWIVETHSELLIRRIRTRIAQGDISPSDVSVLYVNPDDDDCEGSAIKPLRLDENGYWLDEWPHGFFDDGYKQTRLARRARLAKDKNHAGKVRS